MCFGEIPLYDKDVIHVLSKSMDKCLSLFESFHFDIKQAVNVIVTMQIVTLVDRWCSHVDADRIQNRLHMNLFPIRAAGHTQTALVHGIDHLFPLIAGHLLLELDDDVQELSPGNTIDTDLGHDMVHLDADISAGSGSHFDQGTGT